VAANSISPELRKFIAEHIPSVEYLEVLCLLQEDTVKSWSVGEVLHRVQSSEKSVAQCLEQFQAAGLVTAEAGGRHRFSPSGKELAETAAALVKTYRERRVRVIESIYAKPSDPIQDFADAFRLRKEK
jgi:hypothetical protein